MPLHVEIQDHRLTHIVDVTSELERIATGFEFIEGPIWHPTEHHLIFSDIAGNCMYRWRRAHGLSVFRKPSQMANGNTFDRQGRILTCEHATSQVTQTELDGTRRLLASHYAGLELNSPNDIVVKSDDSVYFTDPNFGRRASKTGVPRPQRQPCQGVYRFDRVTETLTRVADDFGNPNGLCFSLDERQLFVNDSPRAHIRVLDVQADGGLTHGRIWAELQGDGPGVADGMKIDAQGNLYCCGPGGIYIFDPNACYLGRLRMPEQTANFTWGGDDWTDLYITATTTLYRLRVKAPGKPLF